MKTIASVQASNFKGRSFTFALSPFTVVTGPNFTGKTALTDAVTLALAGSIPKLGKRNQDTFHLASGQKMAVGVTFSDGSQVARTWAESRGSVKAEASADNPVPTYLLDATEYFALSDRERMKLVFRIAPGIEGAVGLPELTARIKSVVLAENTPATEATLLACCKAAEEEHVKANSEGRTMVEWLEAVTLRLREKLSEANAAAKRMTGTAAGLTEIGREVVLFSERDLKAARERHSSSQATKQTAEAQLARAKADEARRVELECQMKGLDQLVGNHDALAAEVKRLEELVGGYTTNTPAIQAVVKELSQLLVSQKERLDRHYDWRERVEQMNRNLAGYQDNAEQVATVAGEVQRLTNAVASYASQTNQHERELQAQDAIASTAKRDRDGYRKEIATIVLKRDKLLEGDSCPTCLACGSDGWKERVRQNADEEIRTREGVIKAAIARLDRATDAVKRITPVLAEARAADEDHRQTIAKLAEQNSILTNLRQVASKRDGLVARIGELKLNEPDNRPADEDYEERIAAQTVLLTESKTADHHHATNIAAMLKARADLASCNQRKLKVAALRGEFEALKPGDSAALELLVTKAQADATSVSFEVDRLAAQQRQADAAKGEQHARMKAVEAAKRVEQEAIATKAAVQALEDLQSDLVAKAFGSLLKVANRIAAPVLRSPLEYRDGEIGRQEGRHWITSRTFSGTEQGVTYAAFAVALAAESRLKLCVLDEIGRLDRSSRKKLFDTITAAIADGTVSQFIGIMPELDDSVPKGALVIVTK